LIATGARNLFDQAFGAQLGKVITERGQGVLGFGVAKLPFSEEATAP
jgi:hypothetical protein